MQNSVLTSLEICIVNWNAGDGLLKCLQSIEQCEKNNFILNRVIVVDNASTDNSIAVVERAKLNIPLQLIKNTQNFGFAKACNQGAKDNKADYILFLNPDVILFKNSISKPIEFMQQAQNDKIGIVGIQLIDKENKVARTCARFPNVKYILNDVLGLNKISNKFKSYFMSEWDHLSSQWVDHIIGAFFLVRTDLYKKNGGFDESFFVYMEDLDFSYRANQLGYKSYYLAEAQAFHEGGGCSRQILARRLFYSLRSKLLYIKKHFNKLDRIFLFIIILFIEPITRIVYAILKLRFKDVWNILKAYWILWTE